MLTNSTHCTSGRPQSTFVLLLLQQHISYSRPRVPTASQTRSLEHIPLSFDGLILRRRLRYRLTALLSPSGLVVHELSAELLCEAIIGVDTIVCIVDSCVIARRGIIRDVVHAGYQSVSL